MNVYFLRILFANLFFFIFLQDDLVSQKCLEWGMYFRSQESIDSFPILYPDCVEIEGSVEISSEISAVTNLLGLSQLNSVKGNLIIVDNPELPDLNGLHNITTIQYSLAIYH